MIGKTRTHNRETIIIIIIILMMLTKTILATRRSMRTQLCTFGYKLNFSKSYQSVSQSICISGNNTQIKIIVATAVMIKMITNNKMMKKTTFKITRY